MHNYSSPANESGSTPLASRQLFAAKWMRVIGNVEALSLLLLLFVAMPVKYIGKNPILVEWVGPIHGGLFLLYVASAFAVARILNWRWYYVIFACFASVVPFGPFLFEAWLRRTVKASV